MTMDVDLLRGLLVGALCVAAGSAAAGCGERPGTPTDVTMTATSAHSVEVSWRNTTGRGMNPSGSSSSDPTHRMYFDMFFRDGSTGQIGKDPPPGSGPYDVNYGMITKRSFDQLIANTRYCFALRARTDSGTKGCVSEVTSNWGCATTLAAGSAPVGQGSSQPSTSPPAIKVQGQPQNTLIVSGSGFTANASLQIRVADQSLRSVPFLNNEGGAIRADGGGRFTQTFHGLCRSPGTLFFSATDGRPNKADKTGFLWSNTVQATCT